MRSTAPFAVSAAPAEAGHGCSGNIYSKNIYRRALLMLINSASWATELCSSTKIEVRNER